MQCPSISKKTQQKCLPLWAISSNTFPTKSQAVVSSTHLTPHSLSSSQGHYHVPQLQSLQSFQLFLLLVFPQKRRSLSLLLLTSPSTFAVEKTWLWALLSEIFTVFDCSEKKRKFWATYYLLLHSFFLDWRTQLSSYNKWIYGFGVSGLIALSSYDKDFIFNFCEIVNVWLHFFLCYLGYAFRITFMLWCKFYHYGWRRPLWEFGWGCYI